MLCDVLTDELGDQIQYLSELDDEELAATLSGARSLVTQALDALHRMQRRQHILKQAATEAIRGAADAAVEQANYHTRIREEWRQREHWVQRQALERQGPQKGKNRIRQPQPQAAAKTSKAELVLKVCSAVNFVEQRSGICERTANSIKTLEQAGLVQRLSGTEAQEMHGGQFRAVMDTDEQFGQGEVLVLRLPKKGLSLPSPATPAQRALRPPVGCDIFRVLDESCEKDKNLMAANFAEAELKRSIEMSLAQASQSPMGQATTDDAGELEQQVAPSEMASATSMFGAGGPVSSAALSDATVNSDVSIASAPPRTGQRRCFLPKAKFLLSSGEAVSASQL